MCLGGTFFLVIAAWMLGCCDVVIFFCSVRSRALSTISNVSLLNLGEGRLVDE